jgi:hypothetical protein
MRPPGSVAEVQEPCGLLAGLGQDQTGFHQSTRSTATLYAIQHGLLDTLYDADL